MNEASNEQSGKCAICGQIFNLEQSEALPFCSKRCQTIDLGRWATEGYKISRDVNQADFEEDMRGPYE